MLGLLVAVKQHGLDLGSAYVGDLGLLEKEVILYLLGFMRCAQNFATVSW